MRLKSIGMLHGASSDPCRAGFTLAELLSVLAVLALFCLVLAPSRARSRTSSQAFRCLNNMRQLMNTVLLYSADNHEFFPPNPDDGDTLPGYNWCAGQAGIGGADEFDPDLLRDPRRTLVAPYLHGNATVFHCTADPRVGPYDGSAFFPNSPLKGTSVPAARSLSMSQAVGTVDPGYANAGGHTGVPALPVNGPWLTGAYGQNSARTGPWRTYGKVSQMVAPVPAQLFILTEESPFSINDATLAMCVARPLWVDYPSTQHNLACSLAFGDGHAELHKWTSLSTVPGTPVSQRVLSATQTNDWSWLAQRTSAPRP